MSETSAAPALSLGRPAKLSGSSSPGSSCLCHQTHFGLISSSGYDTSLPWVLLAAEAVHREMDEVFLCV